MDHNTETMEPQNPLSALLAHPLLDAAAEHALFTQNDQAARAEIVRCNQRLVLRWAQHYRTSGLELDDLFQAGNLGLLRAIEKFDVARGCRFSTYAVQWVRQMIVRYIADQRHVIRRPVHIGEKCLKLAHAREQLWQQLGRAPTAEEYAAALGWTVRAVEKLLGVPEARSLDAPIRPDSRRALADTLPDPGAGPDVQAIRSVEAARLHQALTTLKEPDRSVLIRRFGLDGAGARSLQEVGDAYGRTREWARLIERQAIESLRTRLGVE